MLIIETTLRNERPVKLYTASVGQAVALCGQTVAFIAQRKLLHWYYLSKTSVHWSVSQTVAPMSQKQKVAAGAATTRSVGQTIARVVSHLKVLKPQNLQCKPSE